MPANGNAVPIFKVLSGCTALRLHVLGTGKRPISNTLFFIVTAGLPVLVTIFYKGLRKFPEKIHFSES
jgi:hypothetical protein